MSKKRKFIQINPQNLQIVNTFNSVINANKITNIRISTIYSCLNNKINSAGGYYWKYLDEYIKNDSMISCYNNNTNKYTLYCSPFWLTGYLNGYIEPCFISLYNEEFRDIKNYEGLYKISNYGRVISLLNKPMIYILKPYITNNGYERVVLYKNKYDGSKYSIHRLVAQTFIPNPRNLPCINHKDEIKTNNYSYNLEWCTYKYNINYGSCIEKITKALSHPVEQLCVKTGKQINIFKSINDAGRTLNISPSDISLVCLGKQRSAGGYIWRKMI